MYRHSPWCDHRFRGSKPRLTPRSAVGFFGFGGSAGSPLGTDHPAYFGVATIMFARPFLPSTCVILQQHWKLSTPKIGASAVYFYVRIFRASDRNQMCFRSTLP